MKLLIVTQYWPPERGAVRRLFEFARHFVRSGHEVSVLTAMPNYPDGIVPAEYRGRFFHAEEMDGIKVYRSWVLPASNREPGKRMIGFMTFLMTALINSFRIKSDFDVILASTPPVTSPVIGWALSKLRRAKFILEVRDLQPESSTDFGNLNIGRFTRTIRGIMHWLYRQADHVVSVTDGISEYMVTLGIEPKRLSTIKSGVSPDFLNSDSNGIRTKYGWEDKFLVLYSGTLGWVRPLETVIEAARQVADQPNIHFVFVGEGQKREALQNMVRDYGLKNVSFTGPQPLDTIPYFLKASDVLVENLKEVPVARLAFPSKLFEYMASGRPVLFGGRKGEAIDELESAGGALTYPSDSPDVLSDLILKLRSGQIDGNALGKKYNEHIEKNHARERWADEYLEVFKSI